VTFLMLEDDSGAYELDVYTLTFFYDYTDIVEFTADGSNLT